MSPAEKTTAEDWKLAAAGTDLGGVGELICQNCSWARYRETTPWLCGSPVVENWTPAGIDGEYGAVPPSKLMHGPSLN
ncbi:hypothetical protein M0R45_010219 [Rubus argutus]|uniref:Uncharacterized protein n=1 Tax=Rubus argutus TaxID=59490 RepID=A0AAW1YA77_RUBAR